MGLARANSGTLNLHSEAQHLEIGDKKRLFKHDNHSLSFMPLWYFLFSQVLKDENGRLYKLLGERDEEMRILRKARDEEKRALAGEN